MGYGSGQRRFIPGGDFGGITTRETAAEESPKGKDALALSYPRYRPAFPYSDPREDQTVSIGGQVYRSIDNGSANVLVKADDPLLPPERLAQQRAAIVRSLFMAQHPLAGGAYGIAVLANASQRACDGALAVGGLADTVLQGAAPLGAWIRPRPSLQEPKLPAETWVRPSIRLRDQNDKGQALGINATLTSRLLGTGSDTNRRMSPPGWQGNGRIYNESRGHLLARRLGGSGKDPRNIVTMTQNGTNNPEMSKFEGRVAKLIKGGDIVEYSSIPLYNADSLPPSMVLLSAQGSRGAPMARLFRNPAGRPR